MSSVGGSPRREFASRRWGFLVISALWAFLFCLSGCGGSSSSGPGAPGVGGSSDAFLLGRVIDQYNNGAPVAGAIVRLVNIPNATATTASDGSFSLRVPPRSGSLRAVVTPPTGGYYNTGYVGGVGYDDILNRGFPVPTLEPQQRFGVGDVVLLSIDGGPPPPPFNDN